MDSLMILDMKKINELIELMGTDFPILVHSYTEDGGKLLDELGKNLGKFDEQDVRKIHSIKSTSLNMGAVAVAELARTLEQTLKDGQPLVELQWLNLSQLFKQTTEELAELVS